MGDWSAGAMTLSYARNRLHSMKRHPKFRFIETPQHDCGGQHLCIQCPGYSEVLEQLLRWAIT
jgi:hypothetical protein